MSMIQEQKKSKYLIEDSVDTLLHFGEKLHSLNSQIEIWSIEKIYGSLGGGIIWCKNENIRNEIKKILKNNYKQKNYIWFIKIISSYLNIIKN